MFIITDLPDSRNIYYDLKMIVMKTSFLDYYKLILDKVSFDQHLLTKEYKKARKNLSDWEVKHLDHWLQQHGLASRIEA